MRNGKYGHELELILLLTDNHNYTAQDIADKLGITRRHLYNYLEYLRFSGFEVKKSGTYYRLERTSTFFRRLHENISLSEDEAMHILRLINSGPVTDDYRTCSTCAHPTACLPSTATPHSCAKPSTASACACSTTTRRRTATP